MALKKRILKNFSIGMISTISLTVIGLVRTALLTKTLGLDDYGRVIIVLNFFMVVGVFLSVRINDVIYRFYPEFKSNNDTIALKGILWTGLSISLIIGTVISVGIYFFAHWISLNFYHNDEYEALLKVYAMAAFFSAFDGFSSSLLRLADRFLSVVLPQILGALITLIFLLAYFYGTTTYSLNEIITYITIGTLVASILPLMNAVRINWNLLMYKTSSRDVLTALKNNWKSIQSTLVQTNITAYLKLGADTGGLFLLGIISSPSQVALYSVAQQLLRPITLIQNSIQPAIMPEMMSLWAASEFLKLYQLVKKYTLVSLLGGIFLAVIIVLLAKPVLLIITSREYIAALPVIYILLANAVLGIISTAYYPLALSMNKLWKRNLIVSARFVYLGIAIVYGLNTVTLAISQFAGSLTVRLFNDVGLLKSLKKQIA